MFFFFFFFFSIMVPIESDFVIFILQRIINLNNILYNIVIFQDDDDNKNSEVTL